MDTSSNPEIIHFKNPFPTEPVVEIAHLIKATLLVMEPIKWSADMWNNILELICLELENTSRLLYLSTRAWIHV